MKKSLLLFLFSLCYLLLQAQSELAIHPSEKGFYLAHTVAAKENYYSIGRLYNVSPKEIESFNGLDMNKGLTIGQAIKIPLTASNFSQTSDNGKAIYYTVGEKEGLYRVSLKNNNVLMANLRKWNHLANDNITTGKKLIVGYLISAEAAAIHTEPVHEKPVQEKPVQDVVKKEPVNANPPKETKVEIPPVREERKPDVQPQQQKPVASNPAPVNGVPDGNGGYFKGLFEKQVKTTAPKIDETATAGIFKTASGWQDGKYYALIDGVEPGTILRIVNPTNSKVIYAKVLGEMSGIRQNQGYNIRMSNAAAVALDVNDTEKFIVRVNY